MLVTTFADRWVAPLIVREDGNIAALLQDTMHPQWVSHPLIPHGLVILVGEKNIRGGCNSYKRVAKWYREKKKGEHLSTQHSIIQMADSHQKTTVKSTMSCAPKHYDTTAQLDQLEGTNEWKKGFNYYVGQLHNDYIIELKTHHEFPVFWMVWVWNRFEHLFW